MKKGKNKKKTNTGHRSYFLLLTLFACAFVAVITYLSFGHIFTMTYDQAAATGTSIKADENSLPASVIVPPLDETAYNTKLLELAHVPVSTSTLAFFDNTGTTSTSTKIKLWPVKTVYPNPGALLPFNRIVAYYGNLYSTQMGVLGQYPREEMLNRLMNEVQKWQDADPETPVIPALDYIAVTAQGSPGVDGMYRARMPDDQIDTVLDMAHEVNGVVFLDIQVGLSNLQTELPLYEKYLKMPNVHLAIDPEFSMKYGNKPGTVIGTFDAADINYAANYLAGLVQEYHLPPKILVIHRFTEAMVTNYKQIKPLPEVQVVMDMDGWGTKLRKYGTYSAFIAGEPVQFTGFKLFYRNDVREASSTLLTPAEVLKLKPAPSYIQYQ